MTVFRVFIATKGIPASTAFPQETLTIPTIALPSHRAKFTKDTELEPLNLS